MRPDTESTGEIMAPAQQPNMQQLLQQAQKMQQQLVAAQEELAELRVEGSAGGGLVKAVVSGSGELLDLTIDPRAVDPADTETLVDLILAAVRDASDNASDAQEKKMAPLTQGLGGLGAGGLPGLPF
jgi:DNA-binding YbaB/EbfC family protein